MAAYVKGEAAAFAELFHRYAPTLRRMMMNSRCSEDLAKDLVQQTFLQLHRARFDYDPSKKLRPWLFTIAMNLVRGHFRTAARRPEAPLDLDGANDPASAPVGAKRIEDEQLAEAVRQALAQLPDAQRVVIEMHWFEERSFREIAASLGASLSAVKVRAHRGYQKLKLLLRESRAAKGETA